MKKSFSDLGREEAIRLLFEGSGFTPFGEPLKFVAKAGDTVISASSALLEGIDFDLVYFPLKHLGYKSVVTVTGELFVSMAQPATLSIRLGVSAKLDYAQISELWSGVVSAAKEFGYKSLSLDLQPSRNGLCITAFACGGCSKLTRARRPEPKSKDLICVSGNLGAAYCGMRVLEEGKKSFEKVSDAGATTSTSTEEKMKEYKMLVGAYLHPELPANVISVMEEAQIVPSTGYFITRGLSDAILRLCRDSGLGAKIYADKIPFEGGSFALGKELDFDPVSAAMNGGDDYRLMFTIPILQLEKFRKDFQTFDIIGHLALPEAGATLVSPDGVELSISAQGWKQE